MIGAGRRRRDQGQLRQGASCALWRISADARLPSELARHLAAGGGQHRLPSGGRAPRTLELGRHGKAASRSVMKSCFSGEVVDRANRPDYIFNPSNDGWFGCLGPPATSRTGADAGESRKGLPVAAFDHHRGSGAVDRRGRDRARQRRGRALIRPVGRQASWRGGSPAAKPPTLFAQAGTGCAGLGPAGAGLRWSFALPRAIALTRAHAARADGQDTGHKGFLYICIRCLCPRRKSAQPQPLGELHAHRLSLHTPKSVSEGHPESVSDPIRARFVVFVPVEGFRSAHACETLDHNPLVVLAGESVARAF